MFTAAERGQPASREREGRECDFCWRFACKGCLLLAPPARRPTSGIHFRLAKMLSTPARVKRQRSAALGLLIAHLLLASTTGFGHAPAMHTTLDATWVSQAYIKPSNPQTNEQFGNNGVAIDSDMQTLVVGAEKEDGCGTAIINSGSGYDTANECIDSGAAYVFARNEEGNWAASAYIKAGNAEAGDKFGSAIALSSSTLAVGAYAEDGCGGDTGIINGDDGYDTENGCNDLGAVYVFTRSGSIWTAQVCQRQRE